MLITRDTSSFQEPRKVMKPCIDQYVTELRKMSETCEFVTLKNSLIKDRIVLGVNDATDMREIVQDFRLHRQ